MKKTKPNKIHLNNDLLLAKGGERTCYLHPHDSTKIIKITPENKRHRDQNKLDYHYYHYLIKTQKNLKFVPECFGFVETNLGEGLIFMRILNYDGSPSHSLKYIIYHKKIKIKKQRKLLIQLLNYLREQKIVFGDVYCDNIFCQEVKENKYQFIIIDGLGARRFNYKYRLYLLFSWFRDYKISKQEKRMIRLHENMIIEAETADPKDIVFYK